MNRTYGLILAAVVVVLALWLIMGSGGDQTADTDAAAPAATEGAATEGAAAEGAGTTAEGDQPAN